MCLQSVAFLCKSNTLPGNLYIVVADTKRWMVKLNFTHVSVNLQIYTFSLLQEKHHALCITMSMPFWLNNHLKINSRKAKITNVVHFINII